MVTIKKILFLSITLCLAACSDQAPTQNTHEASDSPDDPASSNESALFQTQIKALDEAKAVEQMLLDSANKRMREIEEL